MPKLIKDSFLLNKALLKQKLSTSLTPIHLSLNAWTSPNQKTFIAICTHFINNTSVLRKALLALPFLPSAHGGDKQLKVLWQVLVDYGLLYKISYCVSDNHGSNNKLLNRLSARL